MKMELNDKQKLALDYVKDGKNVFITGSAGVGKSMLIKLIKEWCVENGKEIMVTATTGVAAANVNGTTFHGWAGIGLGKSKNDSMSKHDLENELRKRAYYLRRNEAAYSRYIDTDILVIDEVSMMDYQFISKVNSIAKLLRKSPKPFGGIQLVFVGDFFQLGPVQKDRKSTKYVFEDYIFGELVDECVHLTEVYRQKSSSFIDMLHKIRVGDVTDEIVDAIQKTGNNKLTNDLGIHPTVLFCKNVDVDAMNARGIARLEGKEYKFPAVDTYLNDETKNLYSGSFTYPQSLTLKVGAQVMLIKNLDIEKGLVNGSRGVITEIIDDDPIACPTGKVVVKFMDGTERGITPDAQKFTDDPSHKAGSGFVEPTELAKRIQYPLKLAYALTVHKSQGLSIDYLHVDLKGAFSPGQAYVALSRATSFETLRVTNFSKKCVITSEQVKNFYKMIDSRQGTPPLKRERPDQIQTYFSKKIKTET
jgi:ATP-dependent DNA helicase PIF1